MPTVLQASISSIPAGAATGLPSTVMFTSGIWLDHHRFGGLFKGARLAVQMVFKFFAELFDERHGRHGCCIAQRTKRSSQHVLGKVIHVVDVFLYAATGVKPLQCFL